MKKALITGITGQDGMHLTDLLLSKNYEVHGTLRRTSWENPRLETLREKGAVIWEADLLDQGSLERAIKGARPDEIYNLAAQSHVATSFATPEATLNTTGLGTLRLLMAIVGAGRADDLKLYQASSSEMFGGAHDGFYNEEFKFNPKSPYAVAKVMAHHAVVNYREAYGLWACCGILFNHEGPLRGETFVTRKISRAVARIKLGLQEKLELGNLDACRDWGYAPEYVEGMWRMLQRDDPRDYVLATGTSWSVREFCEFAFSAGGLRWEDHVTVSDSLKRPAEVHHLLGDWTKARRELTWRPRTYAPELAKIMVAADLQLEQV